MAPGKSVDRIKQPRGTRGGGVLSLLLPQLLDPIRLSCLNGIHLCRRVLQMVRAREIACAGGGRRRRRRRWSIVNSRSVGRPAIARSTRRSLRARAVRYVCIAAECLRYRNVVAPLDVNTKSISGS